MINAMKTIEFESGERVIRAGTIDKSVLFVAGGELICFSMEGVERDVVYHEGTILGVEQYLFDKPWPTDILCNSQATVCKLRHENLLNLVSINAQAASRLYKRIVRHYCLSQIYEKKQSNIGLFNFKNIEDDDLFIDFKLDLHKTKGHKDHVLFDLMSQSRTPNERGNRDSMKRGMEQETMPYFLTDQFRQMLEISQKQAEDSKKKEAEAAAGAKKGQKSQAGQKDYGPTGLYKSIFLRTKVEQQQEKRRVDRKGAARGAGASSQPAAATPAATGARKGTSRQVSKSELEEQLMIVIEDLKSDLQIRDQEYEQQQRYVQKLQE